MEINVQTSCEKIQDDIQTDDINRIWRIIFYGCSSPLPQSVTSYVTTFGPGILWSSAPAPDCFRWKCVEPVVERAPVPRRWKTAVGERCLEPDTFLFSDFFHVLVCFTLLYYHVDQRQHWFSEPFAMAF